MADLLNIYATKFDGRKGDGGAAEGASRPRPTTATAIANFSK